MAPGNGSAEKITKTYLYLRVLLPLPAAWLLLAIAWVSLAQGQFLESISDYYGSPLRDVFVGTLMATGVCLIAYKGESKLEEYALNFAGVNAFYVALVPNTFQELLDKTRAAEGTQLALVSSSELLSNLKVVVGTFLIMTILFVILDVLFLKWTVFRWNEQTTAANVIIVVSWALEGLLAIVIVMMWAGWESLLGYSIFTIVHFAAAAILVVNLAFAAASHALPDALRIPGESPSRTDIERRRAFGFFGSVAVGMGAGAVIGGIAIWLNVRYAVVVTEVWEILLFIVFWVGATRRAWARPVPADPASEDNSASNQPLTSSRAASATATSSSPPSS